MLHYSLEVIFSKLMTFYVTAFPLDGTSGRRVRGSQTIPSSPIQNVCAGYWPLGRTVRCNVYLNIHMLLSCFCVLTITPRAIICRYVLTMLQNVSLFTNETLPTRMRRHSRLGVLILELNGTHTASLVLLLYIFSSSRPELSTLGRAPKQSIWP